MQRIVSLLLLACFLNVGTATWAESPADKDAIMAILKAHTENWNRHDMDAWSEMLHDDADWVHWRGGYWRGKAQNQSWS